jgi:hypothetical protein
MASRSKKSIVSFNAGELSPFLDARVDQEKYSAGCRTLQNAVVEIYGAAKRRPGTQFIAATKTHSSKFRLEDFRFSTTTTFTLEFGNLYLRFYSNGAQVESSPGTPYEVVTPWAEADLFTLQIAQINDVAYIVHPSYAPYKLSRVADTNWTLTAVAFDVPAFLEENLTTTKIAATGTLTVGGTVTLTASASLFVSTQVGSHYKLAHIRDGGFVELALTANATSSTLKTRGQWNVRTYGTWTANVLLQKSVDGGTVWSTVREFSGKADRNVDQQGTQDDEEALYRLKVEDYASHTGTPRAIFENVEALVYGVAKVTAYTNATTVTATVTKEINSTAATDLWSEGAWSSTRGFPRAVTLHEQRLVFAGTTYETQTVWGSVIGDYENFEYGVEDTDAIRYTLGAKERNAIMWLSSHTELLIGTSAGEWYMSSGDDVNPISPTNVVVKRQSNFGSNAIGAVVVNDVTLFVQRQGRRIREMQYAAQSNSYVAPDLTILAEHITDGGVVQIAYQQQRQSILWAVTAEGELIGLTYEKEQGVLGWHRHVTDGQFETVATVYGAGEDEVWVGVKRTIGGVTKRYIERFNPNVWTEKKDAFYVDCGLTYDSTPASTFSGLGHLEGKTVSVLADGAVIPDQVVTGGAITLPDGKTASVVHIGLPFTTIISPMRLDVDSIVGVSQGQTKRISEVFFHLKDTLGLKYGPSLDELFNLSFRSTAMPMDASPPLYTGSDKQADFMGQFDYDTRIYVVQDQPLPLTLLALVVKYEVGNR